jgi:DNA-binding CsgD family transcriptional regulator
MHGFLAVALGEPAGHEHLVEAERIERRLGGLPVEFSPAMNVAIEAMWRDDLDTARRGFRRQLRRAADAGDETGRVFVLIHLAQAEWRAGRLVEADALLEEMLTAWTAAGEDQVLGIMLWLRSVIAGHRGRLDEAREAAAEALGRTSEDVLFGARQRAALGFVHLQAGDPAGAIEQLEAAASSLERLGVREPGIVLFAGDLVEALVAAGRVDDAARRVHELDALAARLDRPRLRCVTARGRGLLAAAAGDLDGAMAAYEQAAAEAGAPDLERARALLALGAAQRRARRRGDARRSLQAAGELFTTLGADGFARRAREELGRIAGRTSSANGLTVAEARVAALVATGRSNREVATALFVSPRTVEGTLTRVYLKLGVRSRAELVARFPRGDS